MLRRGLKWLDTHRLTTAILFVSIFAMAVRVPADSDAWWHLQAGRVTVESGHILQTDLFSHPRYNSPWINHSWLSQIILFLLYNSFSHIGLGLLVGVVVALTFALVYRQMEGDPFSRALILIFAAATSSVIWSPRPQIFSFLLTAVVSYILYLYKWRQINRLWILPPLFALWANLHAGYALGFIVLVAFVLGEIMNRLLRQKLPSDDPALSWRGIGTVILIAILAALLLVVNPNTTRMWTYYLDTVGIGALQDYIQEWRSPDFHPLYTQPFIWLLLGTMGAMGLAKRRADWTDLALVAVFAYAALLAARNIGPFALVVAPAMSRYTTPLLTELGWTARIRKAYRASTARGVANSVLLLLVLIAALLKILPTLSPAVVAEVEYESFPVEAVEWVQENQPAGEMFNPYEWGGYLIWKLWPDYRVFVDGRTDLYGDAFLQEYLRTESGQPGFQDSLDDYDINLVLTFPYSSLAFQLECSDDWREAYHDEMASIWVRESGR